MMRRFWVLGLCVLLVVVVVLLAPSLDDLRFEPARPIGFAPGPSKPIDLSALKIAEDTPLSTILVMWLAVVSSLALFCLLLSPELRKRVLRQLISFAAGVLVFVLALRYRLLQLPEAPTEPATGGPAGITLPNSPAASQSFQPPALAPWMSYLISFAILWLLFLVLYFVYKYWKRYSTRRVKTLDALADIARTALADLATGHEWGDVVTQAYARMNHAVQMTRGLQRESASTPREFATRLTSTGLPAAPVQELTRLFESVRYGGRPSDDGAARRAAACLESILRACGMAA